MPPANNGEDRYGGPYNGMHMQAGMVPPPLMPLRPMGPSPAEMSASLRHQAQATQYLTPPPSAVFGTHSMGMPGMFGPRMPQMIMGRGAGARQSAIHEQNETLGYAQAGAGMLGRLGGLGVAGLLGGPLGMMAYEGLGMGQGMQGLASSVFNPVVASRQSALGIQNMSTGIITGGPNLSATGQGFSATASQQVAQGLSGMANSSQFRRDTGGAFNRADLDRITRLSGELGMLDQAQSADKMVSEVRKVSKALSAFMKIAEEPDVQRAMKQMAQFKGMGFSMPEVPLAASNARTFARMAGVSTDEMMQRGAQGAALGQQFGVSGATGFNAGIGGAGLARQAATGMSARQLAMAGGEEGIANTLTAGALNAATMDAYLPAAVRRQNGRLTVDMSALREMMTSSSMTPADIARRGTQNIQALGGRSAVDELITRRRELQDEVASSMSPEQLALMPLMRARQAQRQIGGSLSAALMTVPGMDEQSARTYAQMAANPDFARNIRQQMATSATERAVARREIAESRDSIGGRVDRAVMARIEGSGLVRGARGLVNRATDYLADEQDRDEALSMQGDGPGRVIRADRLGSDVTRASMAERARRGDPSLYTGAQGVLVAARARTQMEDRVAGALHGNILARNFRGPMGWGLTRAARGGDNARDVIMRGAGTRNRIEEFFGNGPSAEAVRQMGEQQVDAGNILADQGGSDEERRARRDNATAGVGTRGAADDRIRAAAARAIQGYVSGLRNGPAGAISGDAAGAGMRSAVGATLRAQGFSEAQVQAATSSFAFMNNAGQDARRMAGAGDEATYDAIVSQGQQAQAAFVGQSADSLRAIANEARTNAVTSIAGKDSGLTTAEQRGLVGLTSGHDTEADLRRKLLAAVLMERSGDPATAQRGAERIAQLRREAQQSGKGEDYERAKSAVDAEIGAMNPETRQRLAQQYSGKTVAEAETRISRAQDNANRAEDAGFQEGLNRSLGQRAGDLYTSAGGGARGVEALRRNPSEVSSRRIRDMLTDGTSTDTAIADAINAQAAGSAPGGEGPSATGAGENAEDVEARQTTEEMLASLAEGIEDFPGAVGRLDTASRRLEQVAEHLAAGANLAHVGDVGAGAAPGASGLGTGVGAFMARAFFLGQGYL